MKKPFLKRMGDFLEGKGFYIVLFLCVAAIGISGYYLFSSLTPDEPDAPVAGTAQITVTPSPRPTPVDAGLMNRPAATPAPEHTVPASPAVPAATPSAMPSATPQPTPQAAPTVFTWPVQGDILTDYSLEVLSYNPTMDDWRTHDGLDIASAAGTEVKAAAAGTVTAVLQDAMMGTTVVVEHGGGLTSTYSNLASVPTVAVGDTVGAGSVLGSVGGTAIAESALASHLHFSMSLDGSTVDPWNTCPTKFFPFLSSLICRRRMATAMRRLHCITPRPPGKRPGRAARPPAR
ncbi:MAG: peptidoglycan DD-metalloendopeptidase family protein [Flavonifractor plautii]